MDLTNAIQTLSSEMGLNLEARNIVRLDEHVTGAILFSRNKVYGKIVLMTRDNGNLLMAAYEGKHPLNMDFDYPEVYLEFDTFSLGEDPSRLRRLDGNYLPFLGIPADRWNAEQEDHIEGRGREYLKR